MEKHGEHMINTAVDEDEQDVMFGIESGAFAEKGEEDEDVFV